MTLEIYDASGVTYVYCNESDTCKIGCFFSSACVDLSLYCFGTCLVSCNGANGIYCPQAEVGSWTEWTSISNSTVASNNTNGNSNSDDNSSNGSQTDKETQIYEGIVNGFITTIAIFCLFAVTTTCWLQRARRIARTTEATEATKETEETEVTESPQSPRSRESVLSMSPTPTITTMHMTHDLQHLESNLDSLFEKAAAGGDVDIISQSVRSLSPSVSLERIQCNVSKVDSGVSVSSASATKTGTGTKTDNNISKSKRLKLSFSILVYCFNIHFGIIIFTIVLCIFLSCVCSFYGYGQITSLSLNNYWCEKKSLTEIYQHSYDYNLSHGTNDGCWKSKQFTVKFWFSNNNLQSIIMNNMNDI